MIPVLDRSHILPLREYTYEIGLVIEAAVIAYFRSAQRRTCEQVACLGYTKVVDICDE